MLIQYQSCNNWAIIAPIIESIESPFIWPIRHLQNFT